MNQLNRSFDFVAMLSSRAAMSESSHQAAAQQGVIRQQYGVLRSLLVMLSVHKLFPVVSTVSPVLG
jgi:hypothetical protein